MCGVCPQDDLLVEYLADARSKLELTSWTGRLLRDVAIPSADDICTLVEAEVDPNPDSKVVYLQFSSPTDPGSTYKCESRSANYAPCRVLALRSIIVMRGPS
jgi:hypothetical protein